MTIVIIILIAGILVFTYSNVEKYTPVEVVMIKKNSDPVTRDFHIHNHFPNHSLDVTIRTEDGDEKDLIRNIKPSSKKGMFIKDLIELLKPGTNLVFYIKNHKGRVKFSEIIITTKECERIKRLHVGMITSRYIGRTDYDRTVTSNYGVGGRPWVRINNRSCLPLVLNNNIYVRPYSSERYGGRYHFGVALGTIFTDRNKLYPDFQYLIPATDIYYGVISDIIQPSYGGWHPTDKAWINGDNENYATTLFSHEMGDPIMFPMEEGFI